MSTSTAASLAAGMLMALALGGCMFWAPPAIRVTVSPQRMTVNPIDGLAATLVELEDTGFDTDPFFSPRVVMERFAGEGQPFTTVVTCLLKDEDGTLVEGDISISVVSFSNVIAVLRDGSEWTYELSRSCSDEESAFRIEGLVLVSELDPRFGDSVTVSAAYEDEEALLAAFFPALDPLSSTLRDRATLVLTLARERYTPPAY